MNSFDLAARAAVVVVSAAMAMLPGCSAAGAGAAAEMPTSSSLRATYWRLALLDGKPPALPSGRLAPYLTLSGEGPQVTGHNGCNRFSGTVAIDGDSLRFGPLISTRMACVETAAVEAAFNAALESTRSHRIRAATLQLLDDQGTVRAQFSSDVLR